jgi:hypothetical protein
MLIMVDGELAMMSEQSWPSRSKLPESHRWEYDGADEFQMIRLKIQCGRLSMITFLSDVTMAMPKRTMLISTAHSRMESENISSAR